MRVSMDQVNARRSSLAKLLSEHVYLPLSELCGRLGVSQATARRDLAVLAREKKITRTYGGALGNNAEAYNRGFASFHERRQRASAAKLRIAQAARERIKPGMTVFLDAGTTLYTLARLLWQEPVGELKIVTSSLPIAEVFSAQDKVEVYVLGGLFLDRQSILLGPTACAAARTWSFDEAFLGAEGVTPEGIWNSAPEVIALQQEIMSRAVISCFCMDSAKIGHTTPHLLTPWDDPWQLITNANPEQLNQAGLTDALRGKRVESV